MAISLQRGPSKPRKPRSPKSAHLPANTTKTAAKTLPVAPTTGPNAIPELAEMRGNEREIDLFALSLRNSQACTRELRSAVERPPGLGYSFRRRYTATAGGLP